MTLEEAMGVKQEIEKRDDEIKRLKDELATRNATTQKSMMWLAWARSAYIHIGMTSGWDTETATQLRLAAPSAVKGEWE